LKFKVGLTAFIIYHLYAVLLVPNNQNYLGFKSAPWINPYVSFFEFVTAWGFFAPEPGPPPIFVDWELMDQEGKLLETGRWPSYPNPFFWGERQSLRLNLGRFMAMNDARAEQMLSPYLCKQNPRAVSVQLWRSFYNLTPMVSAIHGQPLNGISSEPNRHLLSHSFCKEFQH
jgi:hypothetical protein